jgi:hypothetical protein
MLGGNTAVKKSPPQKLSIGSDYLTPPDIMATDLHQAVCLAAYLIYVIK